VKPIYKIRAMRLADYAAVHRLWRATEGMALGADDSRAGIKLYLARNRGLCFVATVDAEIVGTVICGHDGRRGILRHLAVRPEFRQQGIGRALVGKCLKGLAKQGVRKCNIYVMDYNRGGLRWWKRLGGVMVRYEWRTVQMPTGTGF
jgi:ribosomal protein S18 acetylase RimI-like enzyme